MGGKVYNGLPQSLIVCNLYNPGLSKESGNYANGGKEDYKGRKNRRMSIEDEEKMRQDLINKLRGRS